MLAQNTTHNAINSDRFTTTSTKEKKLRMRIEILLPRLVCGKWCGGYGGGKYN
jgi:hypothetical protein